MIRYTFLLTLMALSFLLGGCASTQTAENQDDEQVSTIPWNKPQKWEKKGVLGGMGAGN